MRLRRLLAVVAACLTIGFAGRTARAQSTVDQIRGTITGPDKKPLANVTVTATSISLNVNRPARTDKDGKFTISFPDGGGDYWITLAAIGYQGKRFELKRNIDEEVLTINETMGNDVTRLNAVNIIADRQRPGRNDNGSDVGGTGRTIDMSTLSLDQMGDLGAMTAMLPGVTYTPGANGAPSSFSVLGLDASQNATLLNGADASSNSLPRDAGVSVSVTTSPFDVSLGRFSGVVQQGRFGAGSNIVRRTGSLTGIAPSLEFTDAVGRAAGDQFTQGSVGGGFSGPIKFDKIFYTASYQASHMYRNLQTLANTSPTGLQAAGVSSDSAARLLAVAAGDGIPESAGAIPGNILQNFASVAGSFDFNPPSPTSGQSFNATFQGNWFNYAPGFSGPTALPTLGASSSVWSGTVTGRHTDYFGFLATETNVAFSDSRSFSVPYLHEPTGAILVASTFPDGSGGVANLSVGGGSTYSSSATTKITATNLLRWFSGDNTHLIKLKTEFYQDEYSANSFANQYGAFSYNSLADFAAGTPASFTRALTPRVQDVGQTAFGESLGDAWRPIPDVQIVYGARVDGNHLDSHPEENPAVEQAFGLRNDLVPDKLYVSPRVGFSWVYGTAPTIGTFLGSARTPRAIVQGGIGYYQNVSFSAGGLLNNVIANTALPGSAQQLTCIGSAVPTPDWSAYDESPASIPSVCADGTQGSVFSSTVPNVYLYDPSYMQPRALRSTLQWSGPVLRNTLSAVVTGTYQRAQHQASWVDLNFSAANVPFTLADEGNRPVYTNPADIVSSTGLIAAHDARVSQLFNDVHEIRSDALNDARQVQVQLRNQQYSGTFNWYAAYTYQTVRDYKNGFAGNTAGDPYDAGWAQQAGQWHHQFVFQPSYYWGNLITIAPNLNLSSPAAYTPMVASDINGDGYANDRAFVFDPAHTADPIAAAGMQSLLSNASGSTRACLERQLGQIAARSSCEGPWTVGYSSLTLSLNPQRVRLSQRTTVRLSISNPAAGLDLMLHGGNHLQGWGESPQPQQNLLYVRGFNQSTDQYLYTVNPRFGSTSLAQTTFRTPAQITVYATYNIGPAFERQTLLQSLDRGRSTPGTKAPEAQIKNQVQNGMVDPLSTILRNSDSLRLTTTQADSISTLNRYFTTRQDSIWAPVAQYLAALPDKYNDDDAYKHYVAGREATIDLLLAIGPQINAILTPDQRRRMPAQAAQWLDPLYLKLVRSSTIAPP